MAGHGLDLESCLNNDPESMEFAGSNLSISQLIQALHRKVLALNSTPPSNFEKRFTPRSIMAEIDEHRASLSDLFRALNSFRNHFCSANRLPPEILAQVFCVHQYGPNRSCKSVDWSSPSIRYTAFNNRDDTIVRASRVCQLWRTTALAYPFTWSITQVNSERDMGRAQHFVKRSKQAPLTIRLSSFFKRWPTDMLPRFFHWFEPRMCQLVELHLSIHSMTDFSALRSPAPSMEVLSLNTFPYDITWKEEGRDLPLPQIFAGHMPKLRKLALARVTSWQTNKFKHLTHFSLRWNGAFLITELLTTLKESPMLEVLELVAGNPTNDVDRLEYHAVALDHLHTLHVGCWPVEKLDILSFLIVPLSAEVVVWEVDRRLPLLGVFTRIFPSMSHHWRDLSRFTQINLVDETVMEMEFLISFSDSTLAISASRPLDEFLPDLRSLPVVLDRLLIRLPDNNTSYTPPTVEEYRDLFRKLPVVETLALYGADLDVVKPAMDMAYGLPEDSTAEHDADERLQKPIPRVKLESSIPSTLLDGIQPILFSLHH